ncbi:MAG: HmuY family protein [Bacteroidota bacterium]
MQKIKFIFFILAAPFLLVSCQKEEDLWTLPPAGDAKVVTLDMGETYDNAFYFNLATGVSTVRNYDEWDLGFASGADEFQVVMNGGKGIQLYNTHDTDFSKTTFTASETSPWQWDNPSGNADSLAFTAWCDGKGKSKLETYIIDLGPQANPRYKKIQLIKADAAAYSFRFAGLDNSNMISTSVAKDSTRNFSYYNVELNTKVDFEPAKQQWDLFFTKYRHVYYDMDPVTPYSVTGVLINTKFAAVTETQTLKFEDINYEAASKLSLTSKADEIGFDWKYFDLSGSGKYSVSEKKIYIIKAGDVYYKLKFIAFYNDKGIKGAPKFIYQRL